MKCRKFTPTEIQVPIATDGEKKRDDILLDHRSRSSALCSLVSIAALWDVVRGAAAATAILYYYISLCIYGGGGYHGLLVQPNRKLL